MRTGNLFASWTVSISSRHSEYIYYMNSSHNKYICNRTYCFYSIEEDMKFIKDEKFACHKFMYSIIESQTHLSRSKARLLNAGIYWLCTISSVTWGESLDRKIISQFSSTIIFYFSSLNEIMCTTLINCSFPMFKDIILTYYEINQWKS